MILKAACFPRLRGSSDYRGIFFKQVPYLCVSDTTAVPLSAVGTRVFCFIPIINRTSRGKICLFLGSFSCSLVYDGCIASVFEANASDVVRSRCVCFTRTLFCMINIYVILCYCSFKAVIDKSSPSNAERKGMYHVPCVYRYDESDFLPSFYLTNENNTVWKPPANEEKNRNHVHELFIEFFTCLAPVFTIFFKCRKKIYFAFSLLSHIIFITRWPVKLLYCSALKYTSQHTKTYLNYSVLLLIF